VIWACIQIPIVHADLWNEELRDVDQDKITEAWRLRCDGDVFEHACGVWQVDILRWHVVLKGLKGQNGLWEMKRWKKEY
jgi:hypothetical protein